MTVSVAVLAVLISMHPSFRSWLCLDPSTDPLPPTEVSRVHLLASGDLLVHASLLSAARTKDGGYDFRPLLQGVKDIVSSADLAAVNLETTIGPVDGPFTGYPRFSSPQVVLDAVKDVGFDLVITANNHCLDGGYAGVLRTLSAIEGEGLVPCGTYESESASDSVLVLERNGIRIAYLAFTYGTNGLPLPEENPRAVLLLDSATVLPRLRRARERSDFLVLQLHWGDEYSTTETKAQRTLARALLEAGADLIVGCHPHVVQPARIDLGREGTRCVAYSLGNLISAQKDPGTEWGALLEAELFKDLQTGRTGIEAVRLRPVLVRRPPGGGPVLSDLESVLEGRAQVSPPLTPAERERANRILERTHKLVERSTRED